MHIPPTNSPYVLKSPTLPIYQFTETPLILHPEKLLPPPSLRDPFPKIKHLRVQMVEQIHEALKITEKYYLYFHQITLNV